MSSFIEFAQLQSWLIVVLPVMAFLFIGFVIIISGKGQELAKRVAPWALIICLAAALALALGILAGGIGQSHEALEQMKHAAHGEAAHATRMSYIENWRNTVIDWLPLPDKVGALAIRTLNIGTLLDPLSATMLVVVLLVSLLVQIYSLGYIKREEHPRFYLYMALFTTSMLGLVIASSLIQLFIFWELVGVCSYLLIGFWFPKPEAAKAAIKAFVVTRFGDLGLLFAVIFLWIGYGDLSFANLAQQIRPEMAAPAALPVSLTAVAILLFIGACGKSAQFPLHIWLPDAMEGPTSVSALIHAATMVAAGIYLVARMFFLFEAAPGSLIVVATVGAFTAIFAASIGLAQTDMKKVMAYSTVSQLGYMMMGLGLAAPAAAFFHLSTHAFFKALLFLTAGSVIHAAHTQNIWEMGGLFKKMKVTAITCLIGGLALAGIFPLAGFFSKDKLLEAAYAAAMGHGPASVAISPALGWLLLIMALVTVLMTAFYTTRMWTLVFLGKPRSKGAEHAHEAPPSMLFSLLVLTGLTVISGFLLVPTLSGLQWLNANPFELTLPGILGFALAVVGIGWGYATYKNVPATEPLKKLGWAYTGMVNLWWVDAFFTWLAHHVVLVLGQKVRKFDKGVIDGMFVDGTAWLTGRLGVVMRRVSAGPLPGQLQYAALLIFLIAALVILGMSLSGIFPDLFKTAQLGVIR
jgi:NADH-quinone oxidoreductase subunit L